MVEVTNHAEFYKGLKSPGLRVTPVVSVDDLRPACGIVEPPTPVYGPWAGDKYEGGFGRTHIYDLDYWTLRERSGQLFRDNIYCRALIRRLITNVINTGVMVESTPNEMILGVPEDSLEQWSENVEGQFEIWASNPNLCDYRHRDTFFELQRVAKAEAMIDGDILVVTHIDRLTKLPRVQLISGNLVRDPMGDPKLPEGHRIEYGVELDKAGRQVAYYVQQDDGTSKRIVAVGPRSGRRTAWLVYGSDKRYNDVRGEPMLSIMLQQTKELDRARDAVLRKATINAILALTIEKKEETMGTRQTAMGARRKATLDVGDATTPNRKFTIAENVPGVFVDELAPGESAKIHGTQANDINWGVFESAVSDAFAWTHGIPPSIYKLKFSANYSASAGEINEFRIFLNMDRDRDAGQFYKHVYQEWFTSMVLTGKIQARGFIESLRDPDQYDIRGAWLSSDWSGVIKPMVDPIKQVGGYERLIANGLVTRARAARELTGTKFAQNVRRLKRENEMLADVLQSTAEVPEAQPTSLADIRLLEVVE